MTISSSDEHDCSHELSKAEVDRSELQVDSQLVVSKQLELMVGVLYNPKKKTETKIFDDPISS